MPCRRYHNSKSDMEQAHRLGAIKFEKESAIKGKK